MAVVLLETLQVGFESGCFISHCASVSNEGTLWLDAEASKKRTQWPEHTYKHKSWRLLQNCHCIEPFCCYCLTRRLNFSFLCLLHIIVNLKLWCWLVNDIPHNNFGLYTCYIWNQGWKRKEHYFFHSVFKPTWCQRREAAMNAASRLGETAGEC